MLQHTLRYESMPMLMYLGSIMIHLQERFAIEQIQTYLHIDVYITNTIYYILNHFCIINVII